MSVEMQAAYASGLWGFQQLMAPNTSSSPSSETAVMRASLPPWLGRQWTVTLGAMRYANGSLPSANVPPDNQVSTATPWKVRVRWGCGQATEQAIVDYPARGCSFQVNGSDISVFLIPNNVGAVPPLLSGFLTPTGGGQGRPTLTTSQSPLIAPSGTRIYAVADRAVAYRWQSKQPILTSGSLQFDQLDSNQGLVMYDFIAPSAGGAAPEGFQSNKAGYVPLNPATQFIRVTNTDAANSVAIALQFLLDLGG